MTRRKRPNFDAAQQNCKAVLAGILEQPHSSEMLLVLGKRHGPLYYPKEQALELSCPRQTHNLCKPDHLKGAGVSAPLSSQ